MKSESKILALIPARGGSKGIPGKNLRPLAGKPLMVHTIEHALASMNVSRVVVSSDDPQIRRISEEAGAESLERPPEISGDTSGTVEALLHALDHLKRTEGYEPDIVILLQATSPIRKEGDIDNALDLFRDQAADSLFSAGPVHGFIWQDSGKGPRSITYDYQHRPRRQEIPESFVENGSIYIFKPSVLRRHHNCLGGRIAVYKMGMLESIQIDEPADLLLANWCFDAINKCGMPQEFRE